MRYRALEVKGNHYKIEYQEKGGGTPYDSVHHRVRH
jgi:hypothetical protein